MNSFKTCQKDKVPSHDPIDLNLVQSGTGNLGKYLVS